MTKADFLKHLDGIHEELRRLTVTKGVEYANNDDQLANFKRLAATLGSTPEAVCMVYTTKHLDSIYHFVRKSGDGQIVTSAEPIRGRITDAILYLILLAAIIEESPVVSRKKDNQ